MNTWANDNEFLQTFRAEALERLQALSSGLMTLETSPGDDELLKRLFREAHTLKGSAGMMGLEAIRELAHSVEDILETVQKGQMALGADVADLLLETLDRIEELLPGEGLNEPAQVSEVSGLLDRLSEISSGGGDPVAAATGNAEPAAAKPAEESPPTGQESRDVPSGERGVGSSKSGKGSRKSGHKQAAAPPAADNSDTGKVRARGKKRQSRPSPLKPVHVRDKDEKALSAGKDAEVAAGADDEHQPAVRKAAAAAPDEKVAAALGAPDVAGKEKETSLSAVPDVASVAGGRSASNKVPGNATATARSAGKTRAAASPAAARAVPSESTIRVNIERLDNLLNLMGEILVNQADAEDWTREMTSIHGRMDELRQAFSTLAGQVSKLKEGTGVDILDDIRQQMNRMEESLSVSVDRLGSAATSLSESTANRRVALDDLQDHALHVRMLPMTAIFSLYPRVVRDAAGSCGKKVRLKISGEKTEMDKRLLEQIADPLMHIIRNSVDHGIELPLTRTEQGKPEQGLIRISAAQRGDRVEIEVVDDGAGIDPEKIRAAAVRKGLLAAGEELSEVEALELIFRPGFSTAEAVTAISGRGVGLDVVKNNIEQLEGSVLVESSPGQGTRFLVSLPVTLAVINGMMVAAGETRFILPMASVQELVAVNDEEMQSLGGHPGFLLRGSAIPLIDLMEFLGGPAAERTGKAQVVIVAAERYRLGLMVDRLVGEQELVIKSLGGFLPPMPYVAGVTIKGDGEAVLVLNVNRLVRDVKNGGQSRRTRSAAETGDKEGPRRSVLVVEDSLVVRELQRNILETAGYQVETAVDGNDALSHLLDHPVDCVVTDLEMPGMDGLQLTAAIRRTDDIKETPIVMVTSRNSEDDKRRGVEAGANAYVTKGSFDQQNLLDTIKRLVA